MPSLVTTMLWVVHVLPQSERQHRLGMAVCRKTLDDICCVKATMPVLNRVACFTSTLQDCYACTAVLSLIVPIKEQELLYTAAMQHETYGPHRSAMFRASVAYAPRGKILIAHTTTQCTHQLQLATQTQ